MKVRKAVINPETGVIENVIKADDGFKIAGKVIEDENGRGVGWVPDKDGNYAPPADKMPDYRELRRLEYPPIGDQLDAIMKWVATENELTVPPELKSIAMKCMSVKAKFPKPKKEGDDD